MGDSITKGKEAETTTQRVPDDQTPPASPHRPLTLPPHAAALQQLSSTYTSSMSAEPELVHSSRLLKVKKRLKLTHPDDSPITQGQETAPSSPRIKLSSIPPANCRPFFNPPPRAQPNQLSSGPWTSSSSNSVFSIEQNMAATLRLMKPTDRAEFRLTGQMRRKKPRHNKEDQGRVTRPGPSPLGPGPTPYQKVQKSLVELKHFIKTLANPVTTESEDTPLQPVTDPATAEASASKVAEVAPEAGFSSSSDEIDKWSLKVEDVIEMLDEYMKKVPRTTGAQEMEDGLLEIQNRVGVDPSPTWYALMCKSYEDMWESLIDYFSCDALDEANLMEDDLQDQEDPSGSEASEDGPSSALSS